MPRNTHAALSRSAALAGLVPSARRSARARMAQRSRAMRRPSRSSPSSSPRPIPATSRSASTAPSRRPIATSRSWSATIAISHAIGDLVREREHRAPIRYVKNPVRLQDPAQLRAVPVARARPLRQVPQRRRRARARLRRHAPRRVPAHPRPDAGDVQSAAHRRRFARASRHACHEARRRPRPRHRGREPRQRHHHVRAQFHRRALHGTRAQARLCPAPRDRRERPVQLQRRSGPGRDRLRDVVTRARAGQRRLLRQEALALSHPRRAGAGARGRRGPLDRRHSLVAAALDRPGAVPALAAAPALRA